MRAACQQGYRWRDDCAGRKVIIYFNPLKPHVPVMKKETPNLGFSFIKYVILSSKENRKNNKETHK